MRNIKKLGASADKSADEIEVERGDQNYKMKRRKVEPLKDQVGNPVPKRITEIFLRRGNINKMINRIDEIRRDIDAMVGAKDVLIAWLNLQGFKADVGNLKRNLRAAEPYAVCPYCAAANKRCKACRGLGFVGKLIFDAAPKGLKKKKKK